MADYGYQQKKRKYSSRKGEAIPAVAQIRTARARITGVNASYKDLANVCRNVRRKATDDAIEFLQLAAEKKKAIWYGRHSTRKGHRKELGGKIGGFPIKSVKIVLGVIENALANANRLGLGATRVAHILANKQDTFPRMSPKGRRIRHDYETAIVEVVLEESQEKADTKKEVKKAKKAEAPKNTGIKAANVPKAVEKTEEKIKREEMSTTDRHRAIENRKLDSVHKEEQRI